jgi:peptidoglycan hydrolase-like protein with peptidoglycan-binding domain
LIFSYITLATALILSVSAIYYSVTGLAAIFAGAVVSTLIMGTILETSKLVTVLWLHRYWHQATWWLKTYLTIAVLVLMLITSMGIFGGLSNAHVQQAAQSDSATAQLDRITTEIARQESVISRAEDKIEQAQTEGVGGDSNIQAQIDREQNRIDRAYERAEPLIQEQRDIIEQQEGRILDQISAVESEVSRVDAAIADGDIVTAQNLIGVEADGIYGPNTREAVENYRERKLTEQANLENRLSQVSQNPRIQSAREEIQRIRGRVEDQAAQSNKLINRLRSQLGTSTGEDIDAIIDEQNARIQTANTQLDSLTEEKFQIEAQYRQLEAEVGPIKYIAEFVYSGEADKDLLEEAVRWVIVIIIFVFDPLAVLLLIASQYTFRWNGQDLFEKIIPLSPDTDNQDSKNDSSGAVANDSVSETTDTTVNYYDEELVYNHNSLYDLEDDYHAVYNDYDLEYPVENTQEEEHQEKFYTIDATPENDEEEQSSDDETVSETSVPHELSTGYIEYNDKRYTKDVFQRLYPEFQLQSDDVISETNAGFGTKFPENPGKGDLFLRVDYLPTRLFKWNGQKWISVDKEQTDQYAYHDAYIDHLIDKISTGEYDPEMLTDLERTQLEERLKAK